MSIINYRRAAALSLAGFVLMSPLTPPWPGRPALADKAHADKPYRLEPIAGSQVKRVILTEKAAKRLDIKTGQMTKDESGRLIAPYQALFYDLKGESWIYANPEPLAFVRQKVSVASVSGDRAILSDGPPDGTRVVTLGVAEIYGTERGVGH